MKTLALKATKKQYNTLNLVPRKSNRKLAIQLKNRIEIIDMKDILYCQSDANYTHIYMEGGQRILLSKTLKSVGEALNHSFIRIHQSYLININKVTAIGNEVELQKSISLPISRAKKNATLEAIKRYFTII
ncbi:LytR/AlgR family response regulator transcription factor [Portibacter marinus]|uniref:LytR/AlgR family response regulator transcription factor n=1 Tax=Portibacter marinus TaxID=2898660 RepID=UPI001F278F6E|nr:LytTR family DNA-binding domain-containing protein [Portibacter marinus]